MPTETNKNIYNYSSNPALYRVGFFLGNKKSRIGTFIVKLNKNRFLNVKNNIGTFRHGAVEFLPKI